MSEETRVYRPLPTIERFHRSPAQIRCIVGPVGSGKTSGAAWEICDYLPEFLLKQYHITDSRWVVVRNSYRELQDTTMRTVFEWFSWGDHKKQENIYTLQYPDGFSVEILFRSCDNPDDIKKFKSLEVTGYWIDESIEVPGEVKRMLKNRIGRFPHMCPVRFGIETTNPPDVEHPTYSEFAWDSPPPGPIPQGSPLKNHVGFWQPPRENDRNLRPHYYDDLITDYKDSPDWIATYVEGKPGIIIQGKLVHNNFKRDFHVAKEPLIWAKGELWRGWDNSGNTPACVVVQMPRARHIQVLKEFYTDKMGLVDFGEWVKTECNISYPGARYQDWADPAGENEYSKKEGGFTSNAKLMREISIDVKPSEQNWTARKESLETELGRIDGILIDPGCTRLINGFIGGYHYPEIGTTGTYATKPEKNKFAHIIESLQYVVLKIVGPGKRVLPPLPPNQPNLAKSYAVKFGLNRDR
jgi:hypothetical protein